MPRPNKCGIAILKVIASRNVGGPKNFRETRERLTINSYSVVKLQNLYIDASPTSILTQCGCFNLVGRKQGLYIG